jgi:hypothetical protein
MGVGWPRFAVEKMKGKGAPGSPSLSVKPELLTQWTLSCREQPTCSRADTVTTDGRPMLESDHHGKGARTMSHTIARTLGALTLAAALATSSTVALASATSGDSALYVTKKRTTTLVGLTMELRTSAVQKARSRPNSPTLKGGGGTSQSGPSDSELDLLCNDDWFITWDEDADGNPISGSFNLHCAGTVIPLG